jgi:hypothetical protein
MTFSDPELLHPIVHCYARCYWCKKLVPLKEDEEGLVLTDQPCPHCGVELTENRIRDTFAENLWHTSAVASANKFIAFDLAVIPFLIVSVLLVVMEFPLWFRMINLLLYLGSMVIILRWFYLYWYLVRFTDDEYIAAVRHMRRLLILWVSANLINWSFIFAQLFWD